MDLKQIEAFVAVAEHKSFSKAANILFLTQPTVSTHIRSLEKELGVSLFERTTKTLRLTDEGKSFIRYAKRIVDLKHTAIDSVQKTKTRPIRLGASTIPSAYILPEILQGFLEKNPGLKFNIYQGDSQAIEEKVLDSTLELGIIGTKSKSERCINRAISEDHLVVVTPSTPEYCSLKTAGFSLEEIVKFPYIAREDGSGSQTAANNLLNKYSIHNSMLNIIIKTNDLESIKSMIVRGMGFSIMSESAVRDLSQSEKVLIHCPESNELKRFHLIYLNQHNQRPEIQKLVHYIETLFPTK